MIAEMKKVKNKRFRQGGVLGFFGLGVLLGVILLVGVSRLVWHGKFYPGVKIAGIEMAGLTREQAREKLRLATDSYQAKMVFNGSGWVVPAGAVAFEIEGSLNTAYRYGRRAKIEDYLLLLINKQTSYPLVLLEGKTQELEGLIREIAGAVEISAVEPTIEVRGKKVKVTNGSDGTILNGEELDRRIRASYSRLGSEPVEIPVQVAKEELGMDELDQVIRRAERLIETSLVLRLNDEAIKLGGKEILAFLSTRGGEEILSYKTIAEYVAGLKESLDREPQDARFEFVGGVVKEFAPGRDGVEVNTQATIINIQTAIDKLLSGDGKNEKVEVVVRRTPPQVTTENVNELGIRERIGRGESYYAHSIPNRIYNVGLASSRLNSVLVPPGEEFSFNKYVGEVSGATGYRPAYVISAGRTVLGDGGGVCQVSTTVFRAAMAAGLPITERWGHAYRVSYYELNSKPGIDATVYAPSKDIKFKNDTPGHILIQTINDPKNLRLIIEIYGTSDGRVATISEPKVWGVSPPPPSIYQDDPTLLAGAVKQVDWAAWGAKTSFEYKVIRDGEVLQEKTFSSSYRPWANVYLRGTATQ